MDGVQPWMRLKIKSDTFFLPDDDGTVYFRNNVGSFRMEGTSIESWIEKLLPVFDGKHTMASLTDGLPTAYRDRIYEIADTLLRNEYARDVSTDEVSQLPEAVLQHYAPQIEFVDNLVSSGASRFQAYRNANVLVVGAGSMVISLVSALLESGISAVNMVVADTQATNVQRLHATLPQFADANIYGTVHDVSPIAKQPDSLRELVRTMDAVLYVSDAGDTDALRSVESVCHEENRWFRAATYVNGLGMVGPTVWPLPSGAIPITWDTAWHRIHPTAFQDNGAFSWTGGAILANVLVFELFKALTGVADSPADIQIYTLNFETLEGAWHPVFSSSASAEPSEVNPIENVLERFSSPPTASSLGELFAYFTRLTDSTTGIFHVWDEGDLSQLPLAQCRVQPIDPLSPGPAQLLAETVCAGLTHEEARREAGLTGIEKYAQRFADQVTTAGTHVGVGTGSTLDEAIWRGLHQCLVNELKQAAQHGQVSIRSVEFGQMDDAKCAFYLEALREVDADPVVGVGDDVFGFPVLWVGIHGRFVGSVGLCRGMALQRILEYILLSEVTESGATRELDSRWVTLDACCIVIDDPPLSMDIEAWHGFDPEHHLVTSALDSMAKHGKGIAVLDLALEPFLTDPLAGTVGVSIRQEGYP